MHLRAFSVENYRSILSPVHLDGLADIEVFHGQNNAGKSNLLAALELAWKLLTSERLIRFTDKPQLLIFRYSDLNLSTRAAPHRRTPDAPTRLGLSLSEPEVEAELSVRFEGDHIKVLEVKISIDGVPWEPLPEAGLSSLGLPEEPFVLRGSRRQGDSWDRWLLDERDRDSSGDARKRYRRVEQALRQFEDELGPGALDRFIHPTQPGMLPRAELAWEGPDGHTVPFSEQGSGVQQIKDILCAVLGTAAPLVVLEEPETNLSEDAQFRLLSILREVVAASDKQIFLTSHVYTFDGVQSRKVERIEGETCVSPPTRTTEATSIVQVGTPQSWTLALQRVYAQAGQPSAEFASATGILRLPPTVREQMQLPELLTFSALHNGAFLAVPEHLLRRWTQEVDSEE